MNGSSKSSNKTTTKTNTHDMRVAADNGGQAVSAKGDVNIVADEAFELGADAIAAAFASVEQFMDASNQNTEMVANSLNYALETTVEANKTEAGQIGEQIAKMAIPAAVIAFVAMAALK